MARSAVDSNLVVQVTDLLLADILSGAFAPGTRLTETELSAMYGVSRVPIREALRILEGRGFVTASGSRIRKVARLAPDDVEDLICVRAAIESNAAAKAARKATPEQLRILRTIIATAKRKLARGDDDLADLNTALHRTIVEASHSPFLLDMFEQIQDKITWIYSTGPTGADASSTHHHTPWRADEHARIVDAIVARDPERARREMDIHMAWIQHPSDDADA